MHLEVRVVYNSYTEERVEIVVFLHRFTLED